MIEVTALTSGRSIPSTRFRIRQHIPGLGAAGVRVRECAPAIDKDRGCQAGHQLLPGYLPWDRAKNRTTKMGRMSGRTIPVCGGRYVTVVSTGALFPRYL